MNDIAAFRQGARTNDWSGKTFGYASDTLSLPQWSDTDWQEFLLHVDRLSVPPGETLIRRGDAGSNLYFVTDGQFEIILSQIDGLGMGTLHRVTAGSVIGEVAFFDGGPRSASVWSTKPSIVLVMSSEQFADLETNSPKLAYDLVSSFARILATRLRRASAKQSLEP